MKIKKISLYNVKSFDGLKSLSFDNSCSVVGISGKNGAGKSTLLKAAYLIQKGYFSKLLGGEEFLEFKNEAFRYLTLKNSYISLELGDDTQTANLTLSRNKSDIVQTCDNDDYIKRSWNLSEPKNLILYIDASKVFLDETLHFTDLNIANNTNFDITTEIVLRPEELFSGIYRQIVKDHVHDRVIPKKPNRLLYYKVATELFHHLFPSINLSRVSGNHTEGEFVILGKPSQTRGKAFYDVREFSSGEKTLFSTFAFLCISKSVCALFIDEPENHFHETLLLEFIGMLHSLCENGGLLEWIKNTDNNIKLDWLEKEYKDHKLSQVVFSTHSKTLIYKLFTLGKNYIIKDDIIELEYEKVENELRELGLSSIQKQIIFVEGKGDQESLEYLIERKNITVKPLGGSQEVIDTFKKLVSIKNEITDMEFVFLVDSDNKPDSFFSEIRDFDENFYDRSFVKLNKHEFENYLLEPRVIADSVNYYLLASDEREKLVTEEDVYKELYRLARESLPSVYKKETSLVLSQEINKVFSNKLWGDKNFDWKSKEIIKDQIEKKVLDDNSVKDIMSSLIDSVENVFRSYENEDPAVIIDRCDGKQVFGTLSAHYSKHADIRAKKLRRAIFVRAANDKKSEMFELVKEILSRFS